MTDEPKTGKARRGFASMDPERRREVQSRGGKAVAAEKRAFSTNRDLASRAGSSPKPKKDK